MTTKRNYKDTVFRMLFGSEEYKENTLALYNAMNGSSYEDPNDLELNTIEDAIYMGVKNDVSFIVGDEMNLWEHQSTFNPNMPLRGLSYFASLYDNYLTRRDLSVFSSRRLKLPTPRYVVFYNGRDAKEDEICLKLSDSFTGPDPAVEVTARMININHGHNEALIKACRVLEEYTILIHEMRKREKEGQSREEAINGSVNYCIAEGILEGFLRKQKGKVEEVFLTEFDEEKYHAMIIREAREDGIAEGEARGEARGEAKGRAEGEAKGRAEILQLMFDRGKTEYEIAEFIGLPQETVHSLLMESAAVKAEV